MDLLKYFVGEEFKIRKNGSDEEKELYKLKKDLEKRIDNLYEGSDKMTWESFEELKKEFENKVSKYSGEFSHYFDRGLLSIKNQEKFALGFGLK